MKGRALILIFLFLIFITSAAAETGTYELEYDVNTHISRTGNTNAGEWDYNPGAWWVHDVVGMSSLSFLECDVNTSQWYGSAEQSSFDWLSLYSDAAHTNCIGTGVYGFIKSPATGSVRIQLHIGTDLDWGGLTGTQVIYIQESTVLESIRVKYLKSPSVPAQGIILTRHDYTDNEVGASGVYVNHTATFRYTFMNDYEYTYDETMGCLNYTLYRSSTFPSKLYINNTNTTIKNETSVHTTNFSTYNFDLNYLVWDTVVTTENDNEIQIEIDFTSLIIGEYSVGTIELNQSSYTEPELIQMDIELTTYDFTGHSYYIITEVREDEGSWDNVAGTYNGTTKITTATATKILDIDTWLYNLPLWVRVKLVDYNKISGEYSTIYTTGMVRYNAPTPDSIKFGGTVINADTNEIISGATVSVEGVTTASDTTNAWGEFLMYIYPGIYTVTASKTGYQTYTSEELLMEVDNTWAQIYLTPIGYGNGTLYGNVNDADTGYAIKDVHVIITNATGQIDAYTSSGGYYEATGLAQSSTYTIQAVKSGYYTYNGSVTTEASGASHKSFNMVSETATPTPTATVLPTSTYPGGEGHEWTNDEIVTMLRVLVPGFFLLMLVFLLLAVMLGLSGNNGNNGQGRSGLGELWRR